MAPNRRTRAPERRAGHSRPFGRLQMPHRGIDDSVPELVVAMSDDHTCGVCGFTTSAKDVARAMKQHACV